MELAKSEMWHPQRKGKKNVDGLNQILCLVARGGGEVKRDANQEVSGRQIIAPFRLLSRELSWLSSVQTSSTQRLVEVVL